jgi:hypothetical protein
VDYKGYSSRETYGFPYDPFPVGKLVGKPRVGILPLRPLPFVNEENFVEFIKRKKEGVVGET